MGKKSFEDEYWVGDSKILKGTDFRWLSPKVKKWEGRVLELILVKRIMYVYSLSGPTKL